MARTCILRAIGLQVSCRLSLVLRLCCFVFCLYFFGMAIAPTGGVFSYLPHHLDLASEDSVCHSTCMSTLARRRAIMGSIVQPKQSCLGAATGTAEPPHRWGKNHTYPTAKNPSTTPPLTLTLTLTHQPPHDSPATRQHTHACTVTNRVF